MFDKTGTLTKGQLSVSRMLSAGRLNEVQSLAIAQALEQQSEHPIAHAILNHMLLDGPVSALDVKVQQRVNRIGHGVSAQIEFDGETQVWALGKAAFVSEIAGNLPETFAHIDHTGGIIFLGNQSGFQTAFLLEDQIKDSAAEMLQKLKQHGIRLHLLSGDRQAAVAQVAQELGLDAYRAEATPEDKLAYVENLQKQGRKVMMIGDGINDAPVLAQADVSAAVATSADVARDGADVVLLNDDLNVLPVMMKQARRTHQIIRQNLTWASAYNLVAAGRVWLRYPVDRRARHEFQLAAGVGQCLEIVENQKGRLKTANSLLKRKNTPCLKPLFIHTSPSRPPLPAA